MKNLLFITMLFIALSATAQKVDIFDMNGKKLNTEPVELKDVPDKFDHLPNGYYKLQFWSDRIKNTHIPECIYKKRSLNPTV